MHQTSGGCRSEVHYSLGNELCEEAIFSALNFTREKFPWAFAKVICVDGGLYFDVSKLEPTEACLEIYPSTNEPTMTSKRGCFVEGVGPNFKLSYFKGDAPRLVFASNHIIGDAYTHQVIRKAFSNHYLKIKLGAKQLDDTSIPVFETISLKKLSGLGTPKVLSVAPKCNCLPVLSESDLVDLENKTVSIVLNEQLISNLYREALAYQTTPTLYIGGCFLFALKTTFYLKSHSGPGDYFPLSFPVDLRRMLGRQGAMGNFIFPFAVPIMLAEMNNLGQILKLFEQRFEQCKGNKLIQKFTLSLLANATRLAAKDPRSLSYGQLAKLQYNSVFSLPAVTELPLSYSETELCGAPILACFARSPTVQKRSLMHGEPILSFNVRVTQNTAAQLEAFIQQFVNLLGGDHLEQFVEFEVR